MDWTTTLLFTLWAFLLLACGYLIGTDAPTYAKALLGCATFAVGFWAGQRSNG